MGKEIHTRNAETQDGNKKLQIRIDEIQSCEWNEFGSMTAALVSDLCNGNLKN